MMLGKDRRISLGNRLSLFGKFVDFVPAAGPPPVVASARGQHHPHRPAADRLQGGLLSSPDTADANL